MIKEEQKKWRLLGFALILLVSLFLCLGCEVDGDDDDDDIVDDDPIVIDDSDNSCLDDITDYTPGEGPFKFTYQNLKVGGASINVYAPDVPSGCKVPIVHLANGTGGVCIGYEPILRNLAQFGFIAACYESMQTGQGEQAITAVEAAMSEYSNIADTGKIGFTGHSQGGGATFMALYRAEEKWGNSKIYSGLAMQPASGFGDAPMNWQSLYAQIESPVSMFNGTLDTLVYPFYARMSYNAVPASNFKVWYTAVGEGSTHIPVPNNPTQEMSIPWFRWTLLGDTLACEAFKDLPNQSNWDVAEQANVPSCY